MLRSSVNHVLCRKRREAIAKRAPDFHGWGHGLRAQRDRQHMLACWDAMVSRRFRFADDLAPPEPAHADR
ncbi:hypothetical protein AQPW35_05910 [Rubrivivax pictus]|uniref:Uncharacterized protein n=1 Tax=Pseudaquabacterium pictum TaxID=2315236 RepID=A0A480ALB0_9BURK|nr:hypothetical protein AQPW35_05910 [Rubrivivax pictus]